MASRPCKYGCGVLLEGWDDEARKYKESETGYLHTKERCQEAKAKLEQKNDHGNEEFKYLTPEGKRQLEQIQERNKEYVDHTLKPELKLKILTDPTPEGLAQKYNAFEKPIKFSQYQLAPSLYTIAVYYSEESK